MLVKRKVKVMLQVRCTRIAHVTYAESVSMQMPKALLMQMLLNGRNWSFTSPKRSFPYTPTISISIYSLCVSTRLLDATFCHLHLTSAETKSPLFLSLSSSPYVSLCPPSQCSVPSEHKFSLFAPLKHLNIFPFRIGQIFKICFRNKRNL